MCIPIIEYYRFGSEVTDFFKKIFSQICFE